MDHPRPSSPSLPAATRLSARWLAALLLLGAGFTPSTASAQSSILPPALTPAAAPAAAGPDAADPETPVPAFSLAEAPERLAEHRQALEVTLQLVEDTSTGDFIEDGLTPINTDLRSIRQQLIQIDRLPAMQMRSLRDRAVYHTRTIAEFQRRLNRRLTSLEDQRTSINETLLRWARTEEAIGQVDLPAALATGLADYRDNAQEVIASIRSAIDSALVLQGRCQAAIQSFDRVVTRLDLAQAQQLRGIFTPDQKPLWTGRTHYLGPPGISSVADQWTSRLDEIRAFVREFRSNLIIHGLTTLALVALLIHFRQRIHRHPEAPRLASGVASIVERPISSATLLMLLGINWYYPYVPPSINYLGAAILCVPLLRLLPQLVPPGIRPALAAFILLALVDSLALAILGATFASRAVQALLMLPMAAAIASGGRAAIQAARRSRPRTAFLIQLVVWPTAIAFVACSIATVLGYLRLATALYIPAFSATLAGLLYFALIKVISGGLIMLLQSPAAKAVASIRENQRQLLQAGLKLIRLAGVLAWIATVLAEAGLLPRILALLSATAGFSFPIGAVEVSLGRVLAFGLTMWLAVYLARIVTALLDNDMLPRFDLGRGVAGAVSKLAQYLILSLGLVFAMATAGIELQNLALLATAFSLGLGFGLQNLVNNFVSGLILIFERPVQFGDVVEVSGKMGEVRRIGIRSSTVRLYDGAELVVPNGNLISNDLINWTLSDRFRRIELDLGVAYGTDMRRTKSILQQCASEHPDVSDTPAPAALFLSFGESSLNFSLRCWTIHADRVLAIRSDLGIHIYEALTEAGIEIPFPQRDVHIRTLPQNAAPTQPAAPKSGPPEPPP
jgi:potassium-dependent mechanosensitive channel